MGKKNYREARKIKRRKQKLKSSLIWGSVAVGILALLGFMFWDGVRPAAGEAVQIMANAEDHVNEGEDPGPFNSNPPTSGRHYSTPLAAGFYDSNSPEANVPFPEGNLLHNLEHGYVIYWYNCDLLEREECNILKDKIKASMDDIGRNKQIAFPRHSIDVPVVMTSWGRMLRFESFDPDKASKFVSANLNRAPEPGAP